MAQKILFTFTAQDLGVAKAQEDLRDRQLAINAAIKEAKKLGTPYDSLLGDSIKLKRETASLREEQNKLNREFKATTVPKDSLAGLRLEYSKLTEQVTKLSEAERDSAFGKRLISSAASVKREVDKIEQSLGRFTGNVGNYKSAFMSLTKILPLLGVGLGAGEIVDATRQFEKLFAVLKQVTGSDIAANKVFSEIQQFAKETPFQINELVGAFVKLENRNFNPTIDQLRTIGDIAASNGKTVDQFTEAILDAATGEFERLKEFGIVARKNGDDLRVTFRGQSETFKNTSENITAYLLKIGELPGIQGSAIAVSKTLDGSISNLQDNFVALAAKIGGTGGTLKGFVDLINFAVDGVNSFIGQPLSQTLEKERQSLIGATAQVQNLNVGSKERTEIITGLIRQYPQYLKGIDAEKATNEQLQPILDKINKLYVVRITLQKQQELIQPLLEQEATASLDLAEKRTKYNIALAKGAELAGVNLSSIQGEKAQVDSVTAALEKKVAAQGRNFSFSASEEAKALNLVRSTQAVAFAVENQANQSKRVSDAEAQRLAVTEQLKKTYGDLVDEAQNFGNVEGPANKTDSPGLGKTNDEIKAAAGSVTALQKEISKLEEEINASNADSPSVKKLIKDLGVAKAALDLVQKKIESLKNPTKADNTTEVQQAEAGLLTLGEVNDSDIEKAKKDLERIANELGSITVSVVPEVTEDAQRQNEITQQLNEKQNAIDDKEAEKKKEKRQKLEEDLRDTALSGAETVASGVLDIKQNQIEREQSLALDALNAEYDAKFLKAKGNKKKEAILQAEYEKKKQAIELESAEKRKKQAKVEAIVQGALAVIKALPNPFLVALAVLTTGINLAVIDSAEFAEGGVADIQRQKPGRVTRRPNAPTTAKGDNILAYLKRGEMVLNQRQQENVEKLGGHGIFHEAGVPGVSSSSRSITRLASGGALDFTPQAGFKNQLTSATGSGLTVETESRFSDDQVDGLGKTLAVTIANEVSRQLKFALAEGLDDKNRRLEREAALAANRAG